MTDKSYKEVEKEHGIGWHLFYSYKRNSLCLLVITEWSETMTYWEKGRCPSLSELTYIGDFGKSFEE